MDLNLDHWTTKSNVSDNVTEQGGKKRAPPVQLSDRISPGSELKTFYCVSSEMQRTETDIGQFGKDQYLLSA